MDFGNKCKMPVRILRKIVKLIIKNFTLWKESSLMGTLHSGRARKKTLLGRENCLQKKNKDRYLLRKSQNKKLTSEMNKIGKIILAIRKEILWLIEGLDRNILIIYLKVILNFYEKKFFI